ncbi:hypothetical protein [Caulobacter sp. NIBR1757]|uniref:hypothetical protein n=1 Tax=Caulobacter sp. NIBR1757 TaxID=3016000 RepID=UPI0022F0C7EF|nr:hypothetical protein [Caulobacter sp. NIBR1757]WGM40657.1 hypothetical protein AMEJIAPC_03604 [Caulobacter sp. NIBR1757]
MADLEILYDPITVNSAATVDSNSTANLVVQGLDDVKVDGKLAIAPLEVAVDLDTDSKLTLSVPEVIRTSFTIPDPIRTESRSHIDLQPVVLDQCLRLSLGPLPPTRICLPNRQRIGLTVLGVEVFGLTLDGEAQVTVGEPPARTHVVSADPHRHLPTRHAIGGQGERRDARHQTIDYSQADHHHRDRHDHDDRATVRPEGGGLRIRLGG